MHGMNIKMTEHNYFWKQLAPATLSSLPVCTNSAFVQSWKKNCVFIIRKSKLHYITHDTCCAYLTKNTVSFHQKDHSLKAAYGKTRCWLWEPHKTCTCSMWKECNF